jgi:hypothetical protein
MSSIQSAKDKIKSRINQIQNINDDPKGVTDALYDKYLKDLPSTDKLFGKKLDDFLSDRRKKLDNNKDIFSDFIEITEKFLHTNTRVVGSDKLMSKSRLKQHALTAVNKTLESSKTIILDNAKKILFAGDGICGGNASLIVDSIKIKPQEFDILNMFKIDPSTAAGQIMYEPASPSRNKLKINRELYNSFTQGNYTLETNSNKTLFRMDWSSANQEFTVTGLTQGSGTVYVEQFLNDYYSSVELPDLTGVTKTAMLVALSGDSSQDPLFDKGMNDIDRLLKKLFALCSSPQPKNGLIKNTTTQFNENDQDIEFYFDFNDVEGIDLDDESARLRKVLRFADCNNFEVPINPDILEDFVYLSNKKPLSDMITSTLSKAASDAYEQSDGNIPLENFHLTILNTFILQLPKALVMSCLSPKIFLPIVLIYKMFKLTVNEVIVAAQFMKKLWKLFKAIITDLFWLFIRNFWKLIKPDLIRWVGNLVKRILKNKYKRYATIITALIALLVKILEDGIDNCYELFNIILTTIDAALNASGIFNIPSLLLSISDKLPGFSTDRATMNINERIQNAGVKLTEIYGESNDLKDIIKGLVDGMTEEDDAHGFIKVSNKEIKIPTPVGPLIIPPGILDSAGKRG